MGRGCGCRCAGLRFPTSEHVLGVGGWPNGTNFEGGPGSGAAEGGGKGGVVDAAEAGEAAREDGFEGLHAGETVDHVQFEFGEAVGGESGVVDELVPGFLDGGMTFEAGLEQGDVFECAEGEGEAGDAVFLEHGGDAFHGFGRTLGLEMEIVEGDGLLGGDEQFGPSHGGWRIDLEGEDFLQEG